MEYEHGEGMIVPLRGAVGFDVAAFPSSSEEAQTLRRQLYALKRRRRKIIHAGVESGLPVRIFDSFREDAFRVKITRSQPDPSSASARRFLGAGAGEPPRWEGHQRAA